MIRAMRTANRILLPALGITLAVASPLSGCERAETASGPPSTRVEMDEQAISDLLQGLARATNERDFEAFESAITDGWTYFTSGGSEVNFAGFVEMISAWTQLHIEITDIRPRSNTDERVAWATFRGELAGEAGGVAVERSLRFTAVLHRTEDGWRLRHLQSTLASRPL